VFVNYLTLSHQIPPTFDLNVCDMKKVLLILAIGLCLPAHSQDASKLGSLLEKVALQSPSFELGVGMVAQHEEGFSAARFTAAVNNMFGYGIGFYITPEYRGGIDFLEDGTNYYFRTPMGVSFEVGSFGVFMGADPISALSGKHLRKEMGLIYTNPALPVNFRLGFSTWVGATIGVGYRLPLGAKE